MRYLWLLILGLLVSSGAALADVPCGVTNQLCYNGGSYNWLPVPNTNSGVFVTSAGGVPSVSTTLPAGLTIPGYVSAYPAAGIPQSTGSAWGSSITPGTGVVTALGINVGTAGAFLVNGGALGTPTSGVATNLTGTAAGLTAGTVTTNANLTGPITSTGNATAVAAQTGTGSVFVMQASPTLTTPNLGTPSAATLTNATGLPTTGLTGTLAAAQFPALTGDVTTSAGALSTTVASIGGKAVSLAASLTTSGANALTLTTTGVTNVTLPTSGTLLTTTGSGAGLTGLVYTALPALSANQLLGALTATTPSGQSVPSCSAAGNALNWTSGTGFGCATGYLTANQTITLSGDTTGSGTTAITTATNSIGGKAVSLGGSFTMSGAFTFTGTLTAATAVTFPTSGTLLTTTGSGASLTGILWSQIGSTPTTLAGYGITSPLPVAQGGTAASSASGTALDNITGFASTGLLARTGAGTYSFTAPGTGVLTALAVNVGTAGAFVTNGGALGTPTSGTATNLTGTAASLTAGAANAINSASTTVNVNAAAAPTFGKVLTATSGTTATWQTPNAGGNYPLANLYNAFATINSQIVRLVNLGDSILTCNQQAPCGYGPVRLGSTFVLYLIDELSQRFQQYSTGYRAIVRLSNATTTVSAADGYVLTSGSLTNSTLLGPQESGVSLNGGSLLTLSNAGVITITVGQPYSSVNIACVQGSAINGYTVTINGSAVGSACNSQSGAATATIQNFANPVAFASQPATGSTFTLTALGATNYLYAYEGVLFCTAANTACTTGFAIDNLGVGGASSPWFASGTKAGATDGGMVWVKAFAGQLAGCVLSNGENDANAGSAVTSTQQNAQNQIVATDCLAKNASVIFMVPPPFNSGGAPATYAALQQGSLTYCQSQGWACLNMADLFMGDQSGTLSSAFPFTAQDTGAGLTPPWSVAQGLINNSDTQHLNDCGELLVTQQFILMAFSSEISFPVSQACNQNPAKSAISSAYTNATAGFTIVQGATANTGQLEFVAPVNQGFSGTCTGYMQVGTTGVVSFELVGSAAVSNINLTLRYQTAANSVYSFASATAINTGINTASITAASNLQWVLDINGVNSTTANSFAVEAHEATGTMTIPAGASCVTQLNGPQ